MDEHVNFLKSLFASQLGFEEGVRRLLSHCQSIEPSAMWEQMELLDFQRDLADFTLWVSRSMPANHPEQVLFRAFYFGISEDGGSIQLDGSAEYDETDIHCSWACSPVFHAGEDWADSPVLGSIQLISEMHDGDIPILLYVLCLGYVGLLIQQSIPHSLWSAQGRKTPVAVGFLDGDAYIVLSDRGPNAG